MRTAVLVAFALSVSAVAAPVPKALKKPSDAALLEGKWVSVTLDTGHGPQPYDDFTVMFKEGTMTEVSLGIESVGPFTLDDFTTPKQLNVTFAVEMEPLAQIYKLEGDTLTLCRGRANQPRVTEFKGGNASPCVVLRRAKDKE